MQRKEFSGEIWTNIHPQLMQVLCKVNTEPVENGVGNDKYSLHASQLMQSYFDKKIYTTYTINGTAANILALKAMTDNFSSVVCAEQSHLNTNECCALEYNLGCKILSVDTPDAKLTTELLKDYLIEKKRFKLRPKVLVLTQPTELGTLYTIDELKQLTAFAHANDMYVYVDGARLTYALAELNVTFKQMLEDTDIDAFTFGGTKVGALFGEMIVFRREEFAKNLKYSQKQSMQHLDKSKFLGAQIEYLLESNLWHDVATTGNKMAKKLQSKLLEKGIEIVYPVQCNTVFCRLTDEQLARVNSVYDIHYWFITEKIVRLCTTYLTTDEAIDTLVSLL